MLKFFRSIRKELVAKGKLRRYLFYAIGEVILVVIGILIALQVNNFNEHQNNRREEQILLNSLKAELQDNQLQLVEKINYIGTSLERDSILFSKLSSQDPDISSKLINKVCGRLGVPSTYDPSQGVIKTILNSGKLNVVENEELKVELSAMEGKIDDLKSIQNDISDFMSTSANPYLIDNYSLGIAFEYQETPRFELNRSILTEDIRFENLVIKHFGINTAMQQKLIAIHQSNRKIIELIQNVSEN